MISLFPSLIFSFNQLSGSIGPFFMECWEWYFKWVNQPSITITLHRLQAGTTLSRVGTIREREELRVIFHGWLLPIVTPIIGKNDSLHAPNINHTFHHLIFRGKTSEFTLLNLLRYVRLMYDICDRHMPSNLWSWYENQKFSGSLINGRKEIRMNNK